jgi:hypothetical protein
VVFCVFATFNYTDIFLSSVITDQLNHRRLDLVVPIDE